MEKHDAVPVSRLGAGAGGRSLAIPIMTRRALREGPHGPTTNEFARFLCACSGAVRRFLVIRRIAGGSRTRRNSIFLLIVIYSCGGFRAATPVMRSDSALSKPLEISRESCLPANRTLAFFANPFACLDAAREKTLVIENARVTPVADKWGGVLTALCLLVFMAFYAVGPGVCVWLALSELMPTRIRSTGMSIALLINQSVSTAIAAAFLPTVGRCGYAMAFWAFAGSTVVYFITATFFLPETKGKTLEEIEAYFTQNNEKERKV